MTNTSMTWNAAASLSAFLDFTRKGELGNPMTTRWFCCFSRCLTPAVPPSPLEAKQHLPAMCHGLWEAPTVQKTWLQQEWEFRCLIDVHSMPLGFECKFVPSRFPEAGAGS